MIYEIYIDGELVDVDSSTELPINLQVFDVNSMRSVLSNYTKTIRLPKTERNKKILGFAGEFESASDKVYNKLPIVVIKDGVEIISALGSCFVNSVSDAYEINILYGNYGFFSDIENLKMNDMDTSDIDHNWNYDAIYNSSLYALRFTKDYVYPIVEWNKQYLNEERIDIYGVWNDAAKIDLEKLLPVLSVRYLLEKIITDAGYTYEDEDDVLSYFDDKYISLVNTLGDDTTTYQITQGSAYDTTGYTEVTLYPLGDPDLRWGAFLFDTVTGGYINQWHNRYFLEGVDAYQFTAYRVGCNAHLHGGIAFTVAAIPYAPGPSKSCLVRFGLGVCDNSPVVIDKDSGNAVEAYSFVDSIEYDIASDTESEFYIYIPLDVEVKAKEILFFGVEITYWDGTLTPIAVDIKDVYWNFYEDTPIEHNIAHNFGFGYHINFGINLPVVSQISFLKECLLLGGLVMTSSYYDRKIYFKKFNNIASNLHIANDWTNRINMADRENTVTFIPDGYYKRNNFKYLAIDDDDDKELEIGNGYFDIDNQMLGEAEVYHQSIFRCSKYIEYYLLKILQIDATDLTYASKAPGPRIMILKSVTNNYMTFGSDLEGVDDEQYTDAVFAFFVNDTNLDYELGTDDLDFQNILNNNHSLLINMLQNFKKGSFSILLYDSDIANFNHLIPIWLEQYNSYFYVNKITDYIDELTTTDLIKLY